MSLLLFFAMDQATKVASRGEKIPWYSRWANNSPRLRLGSTEPRQRRQAQALRCYAELPWITGSGGWGRPVAWLWSQTLHMPSKSKINGKLYLHVDRVSQFRARETHQESLLQQFGKVWPMLMIGRSLTARGSLYSCMVNWKHCTLAHNSVTRINNVHPCSSLQLARTLYAMYTVYIRLFAGKLPNTVCCHIWYIYGSGQPYSSLITRLQLIKPWPSHNM
jgi:hypothetical protein